MTRIIAIANQKGGTGKTTSTINLAAGLARQQLRTLLVDMDPQANATAVFLGVPFAAGPRQPNVSTVYELLVSQTPANRALKRIALQSLPGETKQMTVDILPAHLDLASAELELVNVFERERRLLQALHPIKRHYDFIVMDCPPSLGLLTINALMAATEVLIPVDVGVFPVIGLNLLRSTIQMVSRANNNLHISGVIPTLADRTALSRDTQEELASTFGDLLLPSIPRRVAIGEAHAAGVDIFAYDAQGDSRSAYADLVAEVIRRG